MLDEEPDIEVVGEAANGRELLDVLEAQEADVVLLDLRMPEVGGLEALERLRLSFPAVRVVVLTMHDEPGYVRRAIELGASGYLLKSTDRAELVRALTAVADGNAYVQAALTGSLLDDLVGRTSAGATASLSPRQLQVLQAVAEGLENKQIAHRLKVSEATVKTYLKAIFATLGVTGRAEAVAVGLRMGIIE